jgi:hypothetical protein
MELPGIVTLALEVIAIIFLLRVALVVLTFFVVFFKLLYHQTLYQSRWTPKVGDECYFTKWSRTYKQDEVMRK